MHLSVEVELVRRESGRSSTMLPLLIKLPYKLEPVATDRMDVPQSLLPCELLLPHCHAISGAPRPSSVRSARCRGGGSGGGMGSRAFGIDIGIEVGEDAELKELDLLDIREGIESCI
jgi:hypothetical protein